MRGRAGGGAAAPLSPLRSPACAHPTAAAKLLLSPPFFLAELDSSSYLYRCLWVVPLCEKGTAPHPAVPPSRVPFPLELFHLAFHEREKRCAKGDNAPQGRHSAGPPSPVTPSVKYRTSSRGRQESTVGESARWRTPLFAEWYNPRALEEARGRIQLGKEKGRMRIQIVTGGGSHIPLPLPRDVPYVPFLEGGNRPRAVHVTCCLPTAQPLRPPPACRVWYAPPP